MANRKRKVKKEKYPRLKKETEQIRKNLLKEGAILSNSDLPAEIEDIFYKNIYDFEKAYKNARQIRLYNYLGKPYFKKAEELTDKELASGLVYLLELMNENYISLDILCKVDNRTIYRFITEELFEYEIEDVRIDGMYTSFTYEEFHPNHECDIRNHCTEFITGLLKKDEFVLSTFLTREGETEGWFKKFIDSYSSLTLKHFELQSLTYDQDTAHVVFNIDFTGIIEGTSLRHHYKGEGFAELLYSYDFWCVNKVHFPDGTVN